MTQAERHDATMVAYRRSADDMLREAASLRATARGLLGLSERYPALACKLAEDAGLHYAEAVALEARAAA
jgi:hypothetical protein